MWDIFISHASEDKEAVARPLAEELQRRGFRVWYDETTLKLGDSLRQSIDEGLAKSRFGLVILSPFFFSKKWTQRELNGLVSRGTLGGNDILPVWHRVSFAEVAKFSPMLADLYAFSTERGIPTVADAVEKILKQEQLPQKGTGHQQADEAERKITGVPAEVLVYTLKAALAEQYAVPDADEVMQALGISADEYADAVEELQSLGLVRTQGNGNHASGYARAIASAATLVQVGNQHLPEFDLRAELEQLLNAFGSSGREMTSIETVMEQVPIPLPRLTVLVEFLKEADMIETGGIGRLGTPDFDRGRLTPKGKRVSRGQDPLPFLD